MNILLIFLTKNVNFRLSSIKAVTLWNLWLHHPLPLPIPLPLPLKEATLWTAATFGSINDKKGFVKVNWSPYLLRRIYCTLWKRELLRAWSLVIPWKGGWCGTQYFDFLAMAFTDILIKLCGIWLIPPTHTPPPLNLQSIFFSPPFNSVRDGWFPHCSPWKPCNPPSPLKKIFYPTPLAIKMTLPLVSLLIQKLRPKQVNFLNDLLLLTLPLPTI